MKSRLRTLARTLLSGFFLITGTLHFYTVDFLMRMMPPYIPYPLLVIYVSGVAELGLAIALLFPSCRLISRYVSIALLLAVFPANIHMAQHPELFPEISTAITIARLPFQLAFIAWAWFATSK